MAKQTRTSAPARNEPRPAVTVNRTERTLAFMLAGVIGVSLLCIAVLIVAWLTIHEIPGTGVWPLVTVLPEVGLPFGMLIVIALLAVAWTRRARENRDATR